MKLASSVAAFALAVSAIMTSKAAANAGGGYVDGNRLLDACGRSDEANSGKDLTFCIGYITGGVDMILAKNIAEPQNASACISEGATGGQIRSIVVKFLVETPEIRHFPASVAIWRSLTSAFPCETSK
jgi:hypothetical protein